MKNGTCSSTARMADRASRPHSRNDAPIAAPSDARPPAEVRQAGFTLIELLVSMAVGVFLCSVAGGLLIGQLREHRHLLAETLLQQDLRNAMALMQHEIHRSGAELDPHLLVPDDGKAPRHMREESSVRLLRDGAPAPDSSDGDGLLISFDRQDPDEGPRRVERGFRLKDQQLHFLLERSWQPWTDAHTVRFTRLALSVSKAAKAWSAPCACSGGSTICSTRTQRQRVDIELTGRSLLDATTVRSLLGSVLVRNDQLQLPSTPC